MVTLKQAREWMRLLPDDDQGEDMLRGLLAAAPEYIYISTGMTAKQQKKEPIADTVTKFLLLLWFDTEQTNAARIQLSIDNLLKILTVKARSIEINPPNEEDRICTVIKLP